MCIRDRPEARLPLAQAAILLATAPKSNTACMAIDAAMADVKAGLAGDIPRELQNVHADSAGMEREPVSYTHLLTVIYTSSRRCSISLPVRWAGRRSTSIRRCV